MNSFARSLRSRWNPWRELGGLPRESWLLAAASLVNRAGTMVLPFLMLYLTQNLGYTPSRAGLVLTTYGVVALLWVAVSGHLADRLGALRVMRLSLFSSGAALWLLLLAKTLPQMLAGVTLLALTAEAFRPANLALVGELAGPKLRRQGFALNRLSVNLGMSVGPALGGLLATVSFDALFWVDGATSIAAGLVLLARFRPPAHHEETKVAEVRLPNLALLDPRLLYFLVAMLPVLVTFFQHMGSMSLYMVRDLGMSEAVYGAMFTLNTLVIVLSEVRLNSAMAHWSYGRSLALGAVLLGAGFGALAFAHTVTAVTLTVLIWTAGEMVFLPTASAYVASLAPRGRGGEYMGYYLMAWGVAFAFAPWLGTAVMQQFSSRTLWLATLAFGLLSAVFLLRVPAVAATEPAAERNPVGAAAE
jgi:MFS family permease